MTAILWFAIGPTGLFTEVLYDARLCLIPNERQKSE